MIKIIENPIGNPKEKKVSDLQKSAQDFISKNLNVPTDEIDWDKLNVKQTPFKIPTMKNKGEIRFTIKDGVSISCFYNKKNKETSFSNLTINDFLPLEDKIKVQRSFRFDLNGEIHLLARVLVGDLLRPIGRFIQMSSGSDSIQVPKGVKVPPEMMNMLQEDKKKALLNQIHSILISNELMEKPPDVKELSAEVPLLESGE